jgi:AcrR family transcriptional regulator
MTTEYTGRGDPARSMALLWRAPDRPTSGRGRKPGLSVDRIVRAAIEVADAEGLGALSMRRMAEHLGVGTMSLYTYIPAKAELLDVMLDTVVAETARSDDTGDGWRARLELIARENWGLYHRHPWLLQVAATSRPPLGPNLIAKYDYELRALVDIGLNEVEMDSVLTLVLGYVHGAARGAVDASQAEASTGMTDEQWWRAYEPFLARALDPQRFPTASRVGSVVGEQFGSAYDAGHTFEFGLQRVLDGIASFVGSRSEAAGPDDPAT